MKNKSLLLFALILTTLGSTAQNAKRSVHSFKYEYMPVYPQPKEYKDFRVLIDSYSSDEVALDKTKLYYKEFRISGFSNATEVRFESSGGAFVGGAPNASKNVVVTNPDVNTDLEIKLSVGNIEMVNKTINTTYPTNNPIPAGTINYYNYSLTFKCPYKLKVFDRKSNKVVLDTLIEANRTLLYPKDYSEGKSQGFTSKPDLDVEWNKVNNSMYFASKSVLLPMYINESNLILKGNLSYYRDGFDMGFTRVKSKKPVFDICDTVSTIVDQICDSISFRSKNERHINWHTPDIRSKANKLELIFTDMFTNEKYLGEFKDLSEKSQYLKGMQVNKVYALLLQDKFDEAIKLLDEAAPVIIQNGSTPNFSSADQDINSLRKLIAREKHLYNSHKAFFNFK
jgi:hypothetical protein